MCEEGKTVLEKLLKFMVHPAISSINLTTTLGSLASIARQRPMFMSEVVQAYETLHGKSLCVCVRPEKTSSSSDVTPFFQEDLEWRNRVLMFDTLII